MKNLSPVFSAISAMLALCLGLSSPVFALRVSAPQEDPQRRSGLEESLDETLRRNPNDTFALNAKARSLIGTRRNTEALDLLQKAIQLIEAKRPDPRTVGVYINYAKALRFSGKLVEAEKYSGRAVELAPDSPGGLITHAQVLAKAKRFGEAERVLFRGLSLGVSDAQKGSIYLGLGYLYLLSDQIEKAKEALGLSSKLRHWDQRTQDLAMETWQEAERRQQMLSRLETAMERSAAASIDPVAPVIVSSMGEAAKVEPLDTAKRSISVWTGTWSGPSALNSVVGEALHLGASKVADLRSGKSRREVALLVDFRGLDSSQMALLQRFSPHNVRTLRVIVFYNAPDNPVELIRRLQPILKGLHAPPAVVAIRQPLVLPDQPTLAIRAAFEGDTARVSIGSAVGLEERTVEMERVGIIAAGLEDVRGLPLGVALSRMKDGLGRFLPVLYIARSEEQAAGLEELGVDRASIFVLGPDLSLETALTAAEDWLKLTAGVRRVVRLGVDGKIPGVLEWLIRNLPGIELSPQMATGLEEWVEGAARLLENV